jgi:Transposase DDE domain/Transposase domain (DUF772)
LPAFFLECLMTLGVTPRQGDLFRSTAAVCEGRVAPDSIYGILHRECFSLFPDEMFADLFTDVGRRSVPPMIVAVVMVLQRIEGCSDREAADRFAFDARWKYAAGGLDFDYPGFAHTVLAGMRARLARSERPGRIFEVTLDAARQAGLVGRRRVLDSTPLYDAVATMDTVTLARSAIRGLLKAAGSELAAELRGVLRRDDDYAAAGKPACEWDDAAARVELVDALARDARALLRVLDGREPGPAVAQAAALLAAVTGQDLEEGPGGVFRIARRVARDRVLSTVDPQARHGHKTAARGFDGYKGHVAIDPDAEIITATAVTPGNSGDAEAAAGLLADLLPGGQDAAAGGTAGDAGDPAAGPGTAGEDPDGGQPAVYGDAAYGSGELIGRLDDAGIRNGIKCQPPTAAGGRFPKDQFAVDLDAETVTCPAGVTAPIRPSGRDRHAGEAQFGAACRACPLASQCTTAKQGRTITIGPHEARLAAARTRQHDPAWKADYTATRPKVERKIGHLMRRRHGGRRARVRGQHKVAADFALLAAAVNLARLAVLGLARHGGTWTVPAA